MKWLILGALLALLWILAPGLVVGAATHPLLIAFALGFGTRPAATRRIRRWAV